MFVRDLVRLKDEVDEGDKGEDVLAWSLNSFCAAAKRLVAPSFELSKREERKAPPSQLPERLRVAPSIVVVVVVKDMVSQSSQECVSLLQEGPAGRTNSFLEARILLSLCP